MSKKVSKSAPAPEPSPPPAAPPPPVPTYRYTVFALNKSTGRDIVFDLTVENEQAATDVAADAGFVVAKIVPAGPGYATSQQLAEVNHRLHVLNEHLAHCTAVVMNSNILTRPTQIIGWAIILAMLLMGFFSIFLVPAILFIIAVLFGAGRH